MMKRALVALMLTAGICSPAVASEFTPTQVEDIQFIIGQYLEDHPEKVIEALNNYQIKQEQIRQQQAAENIGKYRNELRNDSKTPVIGNKGGDFTIVEFFDYNCGFCKRMFPQVFDFVEQDGNTKWVMKELPSLGELSTKMAKFALAAHNQGKYREIHIALMSLTDGFTDEKMAELIKENGLDEAKIKADMDSADVQKILDKNRELANNLGMSGVPMFVIENTPKFGAFDGTGELPGMAAEARKNKAAAATEVKAEEVKEAAEPAKEEVKAETAAE